MYAFMCVCMLGICMCVSMHSFMCEWVGLCWGWGGGVCVAVRCVFLCENAGLLFYDISSF